MTNWQTDYLQINEFSRPGIKLLGVKGIVMHWTADPCATDEREVQFFDGSDGGGGRYASAHIFVDRDSATLDIPLNEVAYHANEKPCKVAKLAATASYYKNGGANLTTIGVEMCVEKGGAIHADTIARTVDVVADLCRQFKLDPKTDIYRHFDITGKLCPAPWVSDASKFADFKKRVDAVVNAPKPAVKESVKAKPERQLLEVLVDSLHTYGSPNWNDKSGPIVNKGDVFTILRSLTVGGAKMYQLKSGLYITGSTKYVKVRKG
ncbi:N-acetylmuramoyl-L-alanine amidase [Neobacillus niacini]|uniref:N-acetylmuramoyl-L-alanine amidase n=1 Tax=Neobacillus niacini TaxID=86668 RepID=UPI00285B5046|nr:N-acetylmuramoyl-L-alanine amidase [Neobacillus niacini]MDR7001545.1 N-acetylmuramoyl-L-alanine amidase [Neobacillus niacini]